MSGAIMYDIYYYVKTLNGKLKVFNNGKAKRLNTVYSKYKTNNFDKMLQF